MATGGIQAFNPFQYTGIGTLNPRGDLYDPKTKTYQRTGAQKGTDAGEAIMALAKTTGLPLLGGSTSSGSSSGGAGGYGSPMISMPDTTAASAAAFGRAKDQAGLTSRASLTALQNELGASNMRGSGLEADATRQIIEHGAGQVNEVGREQAMNDASAANRHAEQEYQGRITQRGQDINAAQQAASRQQQVMEGLLSVINSTGLLY
jgi:hypothetical protein